MGPDGALHCNKILDFSSESLWDTAEFLLPPQSKPFESLKTSYNYLNGLVSEDKNCVRIRNSQNRLGPTRTDPDATPRFRLCHTLYQTLSHIVLDYVRPCWTWTRTDLDGRLCHTLYQYLTHLVPNPVTPCFRLFHTLYPTLSGQR